MSKLIVVLGVMIAVVVAVVWLIAGNDFVLLTEGALSTWANDDVGALLQN